MAQLQSHKYSIAWFKLAEFVLRGEKERALGIYRLLSHSLPEGLALQLEADILLSFDDEKAFESYVKAAEWYERNQKCIQAVALYEHLLTVSPFIPDYAYKLFSIYVRIVSIEQESKINRALSLLSRALIAHYSLFHAIEFLKDKVSPEKERIRSYYYCIIYSIEKKQELSLLKDGIYQIIKWGYTYDEKFLQEVLSKLQVISAEVYIYACDILLEMPA